RFWGYDSAMEVAFFITEDALKRVQPGMQSDEAGVLRALDSNWGLICRRAAKIYARGRRGSYDLVGADFYVPSSATNRTPGALKPTHPCPISVARSASGPGEPGVRIPVSGLPLPFH